jgi:hypothetical protein
MPLPTGCIAELALPASRYLHHWATTGLAPGFWFSVALVVHMKVERVFPRRPSMYTKVKQSNEVFLEIGSSPER